MLINVLKSKIHRATVTEADLNYIGSITIDEELMRRANIFPNERVQVVDVNNGTRIETYAIAGDRNSGTICLNGAAARCAAVGDIVIIMAYTWINEEDVPLFRPSIVMVDANNKINESHEKY